MSDWKRYVLAATLRCLIIGVPALIGVSAPADPLEEGREAFRHKDYVAALNLLRPLAEKGDADAEAIVGLMYLQGYGVPEDLSAALAWARKAAEHGSSFGQTQLGSAYREGRGVKRDYDEAMKWFLKAADQGDSFAQEMVSQMYEQGEGVQKNPAEAKKWHEKSRRPPELPKEIADGLKTASSVTLYSLQPWGGPDIPEWDFQGHHFLGKMELAGDEAKVAIGALNDAVSAGNANLISGCLINPRHALRFKSGGDTFDILICYQCGQLELFKNNISLRFSGSIAGRPDVLNGLLKKGNVPLADVPATLEKSYAEESEVALKLAEAGDAGAQNVIARMFMKGHGVKKNEEQGIQWLAKSLRVSVDAPEFQLKLGKMYSGGFDLTKNDALAMELLRKAAAQGNAAAHYEMGTLYEFGEGVAKDVAEALKQIRQAAESGYAEAEFDIGVRHAQGRDLPEDFAEALKWLRKAADQAHPEALNWMATMYAEGRGVPKDLVEACFWDGLAVAYGTVYGGRVPAHLTPEQLEYVRKRQEEWKATHPKRARDWWER